MLYLKAYQAYMQQDYDHCLKLCKDIKHDDVKKLDLLAQVYFQTKKFQEAYGIYKDLIERAGDHTKERQENLQTLIICAQLEQPGVLKTRSTDRIPSTGDIIDQVELVNLRDESVVNLFSKPVPLKKRKHKKRAKRLPKQYDPVAGPDPERWLPRRDRKGNAYKQKKRRQRPNIRGKSRAK